MHDLAANDIVGDRQQRADEDAIAFLPLGEPCVAVERRIGQRLRIEAALRAGRHDDGILDPLRLHQAEDFGAEVVAPVGPRSEEPTSELQSLMRISYAVFRLKKKTI